VLIISPLGYTGLAYYDYSLCQSLSEQGVNVELCTSNKWILSSHKNTFTLTPLYKRCSGNINKVIKGWNYILSSLRILIHVLKSRVRIVHFQIVEIPLVDMFLMIALKLLGKRIVFTPHDIVHNKKYPLNSIITLILYLISDRIIVHKNANAETIVNNFRLKPEKIRIIPHGGYEYFVNGKVTRTYARKALGLNADYKIILFFGNIKPGKGLDILIKAMPLVRERIDKLRLVIAGRLCGGITKNWLLNTLKEKGISNVVIPKLEFIPEETILCYYMASDIVVLPYTTISESGVLRYAQTCGRTVVCSDLKEFRDTVVHGETGYLFEKGNHVDLAEQITKACLSGQLEQIGGNAKRLVREYYNWNKIAAITNDVYDEISSYP
jgi:glycosyltransferase involved in cell wall biosynthesis